ncbi:LPS export ABC transporter periplasmic protein LptC [Helicobacter sp. 13S00401-1]|uniref:LPS export ABC transporter periplasmic protein LptC n=1 Tax=Helicobacter sp. 13S00401-1 TaxID=1905758 RepID=UPI000BA7E079|nr:LPS export ABC transporter periplasmic protein LptC [Helicobacter sp. 13S00401-1]PAF48989.1 LPS export ABC transporter periplasmic protein LptC [Helicobacter sp. 13S00401-1]
MNNYRKKKRIVQRRKEGKSTLYGILSRVNVIVVFFVVLLVITFTSFWTFRPSKMPSYKKDKNQALMEVQNFNLKEADTTQVSMDITGKKAMQYKDRDEFIGFDARRKTIDDAKKQTGMEIISGPSATLKNDTYYFNDGVNYTKLDALNQKDMTFYSQKGTYNTKKEIFDGKGNFTLESNLNNAKGIDITYNKKTNTIKAKDITAFISQTNNKSGDK